MPVTQLATVKTRLDLQMQLETVLGSTNVKFQPGPSDRLTYPCILYTLTSVVTRRADNKTYTVNKKWQIIHISKTYDETIIERMFEAFCMCSFERMYVSEGLYHHVFYVY